MKTVLDFAQMKARHEKITMLTCYDYTSARIVAETNIDCLLVGDSAAMTMHGFASTLPATVEMMALHTAAVARGAPHTFILGDLPFLSYRQSLSKNVNAVKTLMQAGAHAVKLEGAVGNLKLISHLVASGVPVVGHLGLTPQSVHALGGYKVQGKTESAQTALKESAKALEAAGCFALVLECVPEALATELTALLEIPTIGIGAGAGTDGQVLVFQDLLGLHLPTDKVPKFVKPYLAGRALMQESIQSYIHEVKTGVFPSYEYSYHP